MADDWRGQREHFLKVVNTLKAEATQLKSKDDALSAEMSRVSEEVRDVLQSLEILETRAPAGQAVSPATGETTASAVASESS